MFGGRSDDGIGNLSDFDSELLFHGDFFVK
jgi:hypothetical protein